MLVAPALWTRSGDEAVTGFEGRVRRVQQCARRWLLCVGEHGRSVLWDAHLAGCEAIWSRGSKADAVPYLREAREECMRPAGDASWKVLVPALVFGV